MGENSQDSLEKTALLNSSKFQNLLKDTVIQTEVLSMKLLTQVSGIVLIVQKYTQKLKSSWY